MDPICALRANRGAFHCKIEHYEARILPREEELRKKQGE